MKGPQKKRKAPAPKDEAPKGKAKKIKAPEEAPEAAPAVEAEAAPLADKPIESAAVRFWRNSSTELTAREINTLYNNLLQPDPTGKTLLSWAVSGETVLDEAAPNPEARKALFSALLKKEGIDLHARNADGTTALSVMVSSVKSVDELSSWEAFLTPDDFTQRDDHNLTPIFYIPMTDPALTLSLLKRFATLTSSCNLLVQDGKYIEGGRPPRNLLTHFAGDAEVQTFLKGENPQSEAEHTILNIAHHLSDPASTLPPSTTIFTDAAIGILSLSNRAADLAPGTDGGGSSAAPH